MVIGFLGINSKSVSHSILFEKSGYKCLLYDQDENLVFNLNNKIFITNEPDIQVNLIDRKSLSASTEVTEVIKESDIIFSFVECLPNSDKTIDIGNVLEVIQQFYLSSHVDISLFDKKFILSTVLNSCDSKLILEKISQFGIHYGYIPTYTIEGDVYRSILNNESLIVGTHSTELFQQINDLFRSIKSGTSNVIMMSPESAEVVKFAISAIIANKIVVTNLIGDLMTTMGLEKEIPLVVNSISSDKRVGSHTFKYGLGYGGPNLGKEIRAFSEFIKSKKVEYNLLDVIDLANDEHLIYLKYHNMQLNPNKEIPFVMDSLGYKHGIKNIEDSQKFKLCVELLNEGYIMNVIEDLDISKKFTSLSESYDNRLRFYKRGTNPEGIKIK